MAESRASKIREVPWRGRDALVVYLLPWVILPLVLMIWLSILAPLNADIRSFLSAIEAGDIKASFAFVVIDALGSVAVIGYFLKKYNRNFSDLGLRSFNVLRAIFEIVLTGVVFFILASVAIYLVSVLVPGFNPDEVQANEFTNAAPELRIYSLLALVIFAPIIEEMVFRGFIFPAFSKKWGLWVGAILSSILFGLAHFQANVGIYTLVLGLLLCMLYVRFNSIIPGIVLHMINNYLAYTALN